MSEVVPMLDAAGKDLFLVRVVATSIHFVFAGLMVKYLVSPAKGRYILVLFSGLVYMVLNVMVRWFVLLTCI